MTLPPIYIPYIQPVPFYDPAAAPDRKAVCAPFYRELVKQGRDEKPCGHKSHRQIDDDDQGEVCKVLLVLLRKQHHDTQGADSCGCGTQKRRKDRPVPVVGIMVHHHYGGVDDYPQGDGNARKGIDMDTQAGKVVYDYGYEDIHRQSGGNDEKVSPGAVHKIDEHQEYQDTEQRPAIQLVELS